MVLELTYADGTHIMMSKRNINFGTSLIQLCKSMSCIDYCTMCSKFTMNNLTHFLSLLLSPYMIHVKIKGLLKEDR